MPGSKGFLQVVSHSDEKMANLRNFYDFPVLDIEDAVGGGYDAGIVGGHEQTYLCLVDDLAQEVCDIAAGN